MAIKSTRRVISLSNIVILLLQLISPPAEAVSQGDVGVLKSTSWSYQLPAPSSTIAPAFSRPLETVINASTNRGELLKLPSVDNMSSFIDNNEALSEGQHRAAQVAAPYLKPWPAIKWSLRQPNNEQRITFSDGLSTTTPWLANTSADWSSRLSSVADSAGLENYQFASNQLDQMAPIQSTTTPTDLSFSGQPMDNPPNHSQTINTHAMNYLNLLTKTAPGPAVDPVSPADWAKLTSNELVQRAGPLKELHLPFQYDQRPSIPSRIVQSSSTNNKAQQGKNAWFKTFAPKRRSYEAIGEGNQYSARMAAANVFFDDSLDITRPKELEQSISGQLRNSKDYLSTAYASLPIIYETGPVTMDRKHSKLERTQEDQFGSLIDSLASGSKYSVSASVPSYYAPSYASLHHVPHTTHRKGLEKSLGVSILVGVGAALISFLIISNLFLSVPLFAMTLMQLLNGSPMLMPTNNNNQGNNQVPNNNNQVPNGQTTNGRKRRDVQQLELERQIQQVITDSDRY